MREKRATFSLALDQPARPGVTTPVQGLYLAGAGTHPGGGLTGTSGLLAARAIDI